MTLELTCILMILSASPLIYAQGLIGAWSDNRQYSPGQTGKLFITYHNNRPDPVTIRNVTIVYREWIAYIEGVGWVGNDTYIPDEKSVTEHSARTFQISFTVPTDGRARTTDLDIIVYTNKGENRQFFEDTIRVPETPVYMEQVVTLFTILVVLVIVCTIIMAATIFLSARRPQVVWSREEKAA